MDTGLDIEESRGPDYYWILAVDSNSSRPIIFGPYESEESARIVGFEKIQGAFEIYPLETRNKFRARDQLKYKRFERDMNMDDVFKRAKYKVDSEE